MMVILFLFASGTAFSVHCSDKLQVIEVDYCVAIDLLVPEHMDIQAACTCLDFHDHRSHSNLSRPYAAVRNSAATLSHGTSACRCDRRPTRMTWNLHASPSTPSASPASFSARTLQPLSRRSHHSTLFAALRYSPLQMLPQS